MEPDWAASYREFAMKHGKGVIEFDGMLLDGWLATLLGRASIVWRTVDRP
jgi:hypothetical protein